MLTIVNTIACALTAAVALHGQAVFTSAAAANEGPAAIDDIMKGIIDSYERTTKQRLDRARQRLGAPPPRDAVDRPPPAQTASLQDCPDCPPLRRVPAGSATIGSPVTEPNRNADEAQRTVRIPRAFALGSHEITVREYAAFLAATGYTAKADCFHWHDRRLPHAQRQSARPLNWSAAHRDADPASPATCVGWYDAAAYVQWLKKLTGHAYRLPTEAEWEYAARANTTTPYWWGNAIVRSDALYDRTDRTLTRTDFRPHAPNAWGFHNMNGSVWEWVQDCYQPAYSVNTASGKATGRPGCTQRVGRGGSWGNDAGDLRTANRLKAPPAYRSTLFGFRVARSLD